MSQLLKLKVWSWDWGKIQRKISEWFPLPLRDGGRWIWQTAFPQLKGRSAVYTSWTPESWLVSSRLQGCMGPPSALLSIAGLFLYCLLFFFCVLCTLTFIKFHSIGAGISLGFLPLTPPSHNCFYSYLKFHLENSFIINLTLNWVTWDELYLIFVKGKY